MIIYIVIALLPLLLREIYKKLPLYRQTLNTRNKYIVYAMLPIFLSIALRSALIGADTGNYLEHFERFAVLDWDHLFMEDTRMEIGFIVFMKAISMVTNSGSTLQFFYAPLLCVVWIFVSCT